MTIGAGVSPEAGVTRIEILSDRENVRLLHAANLGRIALVGRDGNPLIFPVNYFFDEGVVVFRTSPGTKLDLVSGAPVAFEIDGWDSVEGGWSVICKGFAREIGNHADTRQARIRSWPVNPAAPGSHEHWIGIWISEITGRRFAPPA